MAGPRQNYTPASVPFSVNAFELAAKNVPAGDRIWFWDTSQNKWTFLQVGSGLSISGTTIQSSGLAPDDADYLVHTANAQLSAERVVTDTATITWDWSTAGQAKANASIAGKVYRATLTQSGTAAPVATIQQNTFTGTLTWARTSAGIYTLTNTVAEFMANTTAILMGSTFNIINTLTQLQTVRTSTTVIMLNTTNTNIAGATSAGADALLTETAIWITVG